MGLILKHIAQTKSGSFQYRRRVPKDVSTIIVKREFKQKLGDSRREALAAYPRFHATVEREIEAARMQLTQNQIPQASNVTELEAYQEALRLRREMLNDGLTGSDMASAADLIVHRYPMDPETDAPIGASLADAYRINMLRLGPERLPAPQPTLDDARKLYLKEHLRADSPDTDHRVVGLANRVIDAAIAEIGCNPALSAITREDARRIRDHMLDRVKMTGKGIGEKVSASTVSRELSIISAIFNFAVVEFGLEGSIQNPFSRLPVARVAKGQGQKASEKRAPLPSDVLMETRQRVIAKATPELALVWRLIEGTGCRIAEVTGLLAGDVRLAGEFPHIRIEPNAVRSLKTETSRREVPLVGDALAAAKEALERVQAEGGNGSLFPSYGRPRGSDAASASLMKHLRKVSPDGKHVIHSLRHNMKDWLVLAEVPSLEQNLILGHTLGGVGDRVYGGEVAKLRATTRAMMRAHEMKEMR
ncbi:tyrosine-type recombinase/integrase [Paracoccus aerodenitrificans]|uniref:tyrosine-type recombinase/integrase n=1 Tax=Paracoccus aerodenitrificans TaxID=3017781 RepID=UPI0022F0FCDD|nr:tyrosine-type recombinase/integrase [Paracoccus aerodenitrificans]WBU63117.1 tyrosine-type recombinase/integrase [Paracoccus aerodenitrificans]